MTTADRDADAVVEVAVPRAGSEAEASEDGRCPSCDTRDAWTTSRRHRFSPFGAVLAGVLAFWTAVLGLLFDVSLWPAAVLAAVGVYVGLARRTVRICGACGLVRPDD